MRPLQWVRRADEDAALVEVLEYVEKSTSSGTKRARLTVKAAPTSSSASTAKSGDDKKQSAKEVARKSAMELFSQLLVFFFVF